MEPWIAERMKGLEVVTGWDIHIKDGTDDRLGHMFVTGVNYAVWRRVYNGAYWSGWASLGDSLLLRPAQRVIFRCAVMTLINRSNQLESSNFGWVKVRSSILGDSPRSSRMRH